MMVSNNKEISEDWECLCTEKNILKLMKVDHFQPFNSFRSGHISRLVFESIGIF